MIGFYDAGILIAGAMGFTWAFLTYTSRDDLLDRLFLAGICSLFWPAVIVAIVLMSFAAPFVKDKQNRDRKRDSR